jgi:hypothetical protein
MADNIKALDIRTLFCAMSSVTLQMADVAVGDDRPRCWVITDGNLCPRPSALRITGESWDGYVYTCVAHAERVLLSQPNSTIEPIPRAAA